MRRLMLIVMLLVFSVHCYAQEQAEYTLLMGEFEDRTGVANPLLVYLTDTLNFLFSRSELASIHPISSGLRTAYLQKARNEHPDADATQLSLLAEEYAEANAAIVGFYHTHDRRRSVSATAGGIWETGRIRRSLVET